MVHCHTQTSLRTGRAGFAPLLAALLVLLLAGMQQTGAFPSRRLEVGSDRFKTVLLFSSSNLFPCLLIIHLRDRARLTTFNWETLEIVPLKVC